MADVPQGSNAGTIVTPSTASSSCYAKEGMLELKADEKVASEFDAMRSMIQNKIRSMIQNKRTSISLSETSSDIFAKVFEDCAMHGYNCAIVDEQFIKYCNTTFAETHDKDVLADLIKAAGSLKIKGLLTIPRCRDPESRKLTIYKAIGALTMHMILVGLVYVLLGYFSYAMVQNHNISRWGGSHGFGYFGLRMPS